MSRTIVSGGLTTCEAVQGGKALRLDFVDQAGQPVSIELPFEQAQSIVMTLPGLLSRALKTQTECDDARFVFGLGRWSLESTQGQSVIMTLGTGDGFEVSFAMPLATCQAMGWSLRHDVTPGRASPQPRRER